jgi:SAM-dependent methyltransferase
MKAADDWTVGFFDDPYTQLFPFPGAAQTDEEVNALLEVLPPSPARILDVACGQGRHAVRLARSSFQVTGVDTSATFLSGRPVLVGAADRWQRRCARGSSSSTAIRKWTQFGGVATDGATVGDRPRA